MRAKVINSSLEVGTCTPNIIALDVYFFYVNGAGCHRLEKYFVMKSFLEKSLKIKSAGESP